MESINVVIDDYNDVSGVSSEDEIYILSINKEKQSLEIAVTSGVTTSIATNAISSSKVIPEDRTSYETYFEDERFDITDLVIKDSPSII